MLYFIKQFTDFIFENQGKIMEDIKDKLVAAVTEALDETREATYKAAMDDIQALKEQVDYLSSIAETKSKPFASTSFLEKYSEALNESVGERNDDNIREVAFYTAAGVSQETPEEHAMFIRASREKARFSPFIRNIINLVRSVVFSGPIKIDIPVEDIDILITSALKKSRLFKKLPSWGQNQYTDSEIFLAMFITETGNIEFREIDPLEITDIEYDPQDVETVLSFTREYNTSNSNQIKYYAHVDYYKATDVGVFSEHHDKLESNCKVFWFKYGSRNNQRGELPLQPILRFDRIYEDVLLDLARLYHERSSVVWILKLKSNDANIYSRTDQPVRGAKYKIETPFKEWRIEDTKLSDFNSKDYARPHRLAMAAGVGLPEYAVFADISNSSYASIRSAGTPLEFLVSSIQQMWVENLTDIIRAILLVYKELGLVEDSYTVNRLPVEECIKILTSDIQLEESLVESLKEEAKTIKMNVEDLPVSVVFPKQKADNPLLFAQSLTILIQAGVLSRRTAAKLYGLDPDNEMSLISLDNASPMLTAMTGKTETGKTEQPETNYQRKIDRGTA